jgi:hypothetical protein
MVNRRPTSSHQLTENNKSRDIALPLLARNAEIVGRDVWFLLARTSVINAGPLDMNVRSTIRTNAESKWCWLKVAIN